MLKTQYNGKYESYWTKEANRRVMAIRLINNGDICLKEEWFRQKKNGERQMEACSFRSIGRHIKQIKQNLEIDFLIDGSHALQKEQF